jgi:hypothetical protein
MKQFKVGDIAWSPNYGFDTIRLFMDRPHLLRHGNTIYTICGRCTEVDKYPTLLTVEEAAKLGHMPEKKTKKTITTELFVYKKFEGGYEIGSQNPVYDMYHKRLGYHTFSAEVEE